SRAQRLEMRERDADEQRRHGDDESRDGAGDADVEEPSLVRDRLTNANERAERTSQRNGNRQKIGQARVDVIMSAGDVVAEFVTSENREDRRAVQPAPDQRRADDSQDEQEQMQPLPVLEFLRRLPDGFHLPDILQVFTRFETDGTTRRN